MSSKRPGKENPLVYLHSNSTRLPFPLSETLIFKKAADATSRAYLFGGGGEKMVEKRAFS